MAIVQLSENKVFPDYFTCVICNKQIIPDDAIAGLLDRNNRQQFACSGHFWNSHQFITGWADFMAAERIKRSRSQFALEYDEDMDARTLH
ncbi:MAG TPA: hypothetical protein VJ836_06375 [Candidatus Saccharimonadales bacterium]|nr:hypothetical protein [Candidatus Saccharimonadales bacterium]